MILDYIAIGIIIVSIGIILVIIVRKFPVLAFISVLDIPWNKQQKIKSGIIEGRLYRKLSSMLQPVVCMLKKLQGWASRILHRWWDRVKELERKHQLPEEQLSSKEKIERESDVKDLLLEGKELAKSEQYSDAEKKFVEVISLNPDNIEAFKGLGEVYFAQKDNEHAKESLEYALMLSIKLKEKKIREGVHANGDGNGSQEVPAVDREIADHHIDLGEVCAALGDKEKALACFQEAVKLEPSNPRNLDALFQFALDIKDKPLGWETLKKLRIANPENQKLAEMEKELDSL